MTERELDSEDEQGEEEEEGTDRATNQGPSSFFQNNGGKTLLAPSPDTLQFIITSQALKKLENEYLIINDPNTVFANLDPKLEYEERELDDEEIIVLKKMEQGFFAHDFEALAERKIVKRHADLARSRGKDHSERVLLVSEHHIMRNINGSDEQKKKHRFLRFLNH
jgi:predicted adenine nucleotide alpha hydrolase (AANH) superfamily ATPase